jgi:beta-alanine degradation protein BauB
MQQAESTLQFEDDAIRITRWTFPPGSETGWHRHAWPYAVVPLVGGELTVADASGERGYPIASGESYARPAGVEHNIINNTASEIVFVELEMKR